MARGLVSVVIPTYERAWCIAESVGSVLAQTYEDIEVIVVDDGSSDDTEAVCAGIGDERVRYVRQDNAGACVARNHGVDLARGEIVAFHDSDDVWYPTKLERQLETLRLTGADYCICRMESVTCADGVQDRVIVIPDLALAEADLTLERLLFRNYVSTQMLVGRREVFVAERFDPLMPRSQDWELALRLARRFTGALTDEVLVRQMIRQDSISTDVGKMVASFDLLADRQREAFGAHSAAYATHLLGLAMILTGHDRQAAERFFRQSLAARPTPAALAHLVHSELMWTFSSSWKA